MIDKLLRYGKVGRLLGPHPDGTILDVGAGPQGLGACLPYRFVGVDVWYPSRPSPRSRPSRPVAQLCRLPMPASIMYCAWKCSKHVPPQDREAVVRELVRVARKRIVISHPYGKWTRLADHLLYWVYGSLKFLRIERPWWLVEHLQNPYPDPRVYLKNAAPGYPFQFKGQENVFLYLITVFFGNLKAVARRTNALYQKHPALVDRIVRLHHFPPYRQAYVILDKV